LAQAGATVHLAHPLLVKMFTYRRVTNDERDAADLADLLRMGRLPESWIAPPEIRGLRELVRYRHKLVGIRTSCKDQIHAVLAKCGIFVPMADVFGAAGVAMLDQLQLPAPYTARIASLRRVIDGVSFEITLLADRVAAHLARDRRYQAVLVIPGIGRPRSRPSNAPRPDPPCATRWTPSSPAAATPPATSPRSPRPANCSPSSSTGYATEKSDA
jgi:transposase